MLDRREVDELPKKEVCERPICDHDLICQRYNRITALIPFFEYAFFIPSGLRKRAVDQLKLRKGDRVLEVGCGTGRNFPFSRDAVDPKDAFMVSIYPKVCYVLHLLRYQAGSAASAPSEASPPQIIDVQLALASPRDRPF